MHILLVSVEIVFFLEKELGIVKINYANVGVIIKKNFYKFCYYYNKACSIFISMYYFGYFIQIYIKHFYQVF